MAPALRSGRWVRLPLAPATITLKTAQNSRSPQFSTPRILILDGLGQTLRLQGAPGFGILACAPRPFLMTPPSPARRKWWSTLLSTSPTNLEWTQIDCLRVAEVFLSLCPEDVHTEVRSGSIEGLAAHSFLGRTPSNRVSEGPAFAALSGQPSPSGRRPEARPVSLAPRYSR